MDGAKRPSRAATVEVEELVKRYRKAGRNAVDGTSFTAEAGEFFALLGPNGAGKTTTISVLTTILSPTSGSVRIAGYDVVRQAADVRRNVGIVFQNPSLDMNLTAEENVRFHAILYGLYPFRPAFALMPADYRRRLEELGELLGIREDLFRPIRTFSGGMRRKLEILRSLMHRPQVLFLDEPTAGLDAGSRRNLWEYLRRIRSESGTTLFVTTHYLEEAEEADRICIIDHGRVVSLGTPDEVKADLIQEYLLVDAPNRKGLLAELDRLGLPHRVEGLVRIDLDGQSAHRVLKSIGTELSVVRTHIPSLESAYLEIVGQSPASGQGEEPS